MSKTILILDACEDEGAQLEIENIKMQSRLYGLDPYVEKIEETNDLKKALQQLGDFNYIYLSSHGNEEGFCNNRHTVDMKWLDFGNLVCDTNCLREDCILMLSCCRGGLNEVAYDMFWRCKKIEYVVGPRQSLIPQDMQIGFNLLIYNIEFRNLDPIVATNKVLDGTSIRFKCFDRLETMSDPAYLLRKEKLDRNK